VGLKLIEHPRIALIHATRVAIEPIEIAARKIWPQAETMSILEEGLSIDRAKSRELSADLIQRIIALSRYAEGAKADGVLFTCSAFGAAIERADLEVSIPVMKPNEAMFNDARTYGERIAMIYTFPPSAAGMEQEFKEAAEAARSKAKLRSIFCEDALEAKLSGDEVLHDRLIADTAKQIDDADVILLAQFSLASAVEQVREKTQLPVLTSPEAAVEEMRCRVERKQ